jgi:hypothetical protein
VGGILTRSVSTVLATAAKAITATRMGISVRVFILGIDYDNTASIPSQ